MFNCLNKKKNEKEKTPTEPHPLPSPSRPLLYIYGEMRMDDEKRLVIHYYNGEYWRMYNGPYVVMGDIDRSSYGVKYYAVICVPNTIHDVICVPIILAEFDDYKDAANKSTDAYQKYTSHIDAEKNAEKNLFIEKVKNICGADSE